MSGLLGCFKPKTQQQKQKKEREFKVCVNKDEMERSRKWVELKPDIETEDSVGRKKAAKTAPLPIRNAPRTDGKAVSVCDKNTPDVAAGTSAFKDKGTVNSSKMGGTKNNSKIQKRNTSSHKITISSRVNEVRSCLVDNKTTSTKTEIPTADDSNHYSSNNGKDSKKMNIVISTVDNSKMGGTKNNSKIRTSNQNFSTNSTTTTVTHTTSHTSPNVIPNTNVTSTITNVTPTSTTLTPTQTPSQSNEQHSNNSLQQNATIQQNPSTTSESVCEGFSFLYLDLINQ